MEYPRVENALAKQARTSEKFKENVFKSFATIKAVFEGQVKRMGGVEDRQDRIEEDHERRRGKLDERHRSLPGGSRDRSRPQRRRVGQGRVEAHQP